MNTWSKPFALKAVEAAAAATTDYAYQGPTIRGAADFLTYRSTVDFPGVSNSGQTARQFSVLRFKADLYVQLKVMVPAGTLTIGLDQANLRHLIVALRDAGKAILLVSVELDEIMSLSDRIAVMFDGQIMGTADPTTTNERELGLLMAGVTQ